MIMAQGTIRIITTDTRSGDVLWDQVWCEACVATHRATFGEDKNVTIKTWPWDGEPRPCGSCDDSENAPEFKFSAVVALLFVLLLGGSASAQTTTIIVGNLADAVTTEIAIASGAGREGNPVMGATMAQRVAVKAASTAATVWLVKKLERRHPKAARVFGYAVGITLSAVAIHNARVIWQAR